MELKDPITGVRRAKVAQAMNTLTLMALALNYKCGRLIHARWYKFIGAQIILMPDIDTLSATAMLWLDMRPKQTYFVSCFNQAGMAFSSAMRIGRANAAD